MPQSVADVPKVPTFGFWTPVTEQPHPDHGGQVLVSWRFKGNNRFGPYVCAARWEKGHWDWNSPVANANRSDDEIEAWMPMPKGYVNPQQ